MDLAQLTNRYLTATNRQIYTLEIIARRKGTSKAYLKRHMKKPIRNPIAVALMKRHGHGSKTMKDRRTPRGGSRNKQREYLSEAS